MASVNFTFQMDESDKQSAEQVFKELGMTLSTGINVYIKAVSRQLRIPFELPIDERTRVTKAEKEQAFMALNGILAGHEVDLDKEREERILS